MMTSPRPLVLGTAIGYTAIDLKPFLISLRESGYAGDVCLFLSPAETDPETPRALARSGVKVEPFEAWRFMPMCIHAARHIKEFEFLSQHDEYDRVFLTDTRDVVFQKDPFDVAFETDLVYFAEDARVTIGSCPSNSDWIARAFGAGKVDAYRDKRISCGGTILGTRAGLLRHLRALIEVTARVETEALRFPGIDQAFHHFLLHEPLIRGYRLMENGTHVNTLGHLPKGEVRVENGKIVNADGSVSAVVHQYNYKPHDDILAWVARRYRG